MNEFMNIETLTTFAGITLAVGLVVQFTKSLIKTKFGEQYVRLYAFAVSLLLSFVFINEGMDAQNIILTVINAVLITVASTGGYEVIADPKAQKSK